MVRLLSFCLFMFLLVFICGCEPSNLGPVSLPEAEDAEIEPSIAAEPEAEVKETEIKPSVIPEAKAEVTEPKKAEIKPFVPNAAGHSPTMT